MSKPDGIPERFLLPERRLRKRDRRLAGDRRRQVRWDGEGGTGNRRRRLQDRRRDWRGSRNRHYRAP
ncbi:MAG TPA: hypothetical protein ENK48_05430 [Gammaproteobacteria bacterium]|nr:hypothetical protein [Gammaproteobacteria bacterium]